MRFSDLEYFCTIVEQKSFSKASQILYCSQPALSKSIKKIEEKYNTIFIKRSTHTFELTPKGEYFYNECKNILKNVSKIEEELVKTEKNKLLKLGASEFYSNHLLTSIIPVLREKIPNIEIKIIEEEAITLKKLVITGEVDFAIIPFELGLDNFNYDKLYNEHILFAISKKNKLIKKIKISSDDKKIMNFSIANKENFIMLKEKMNLSKIGEKICLQYNFSPTVINRTKNMESVNKFICNDMGVGFVSHIINRDKNVNYYKIDSNHSERNIIILYKKDIKLESFQKRFIQLSKTITSTLNLEENKKKK